jgi:hypothetical protein
LAISLYRAAMMGLLSTAKEVRELGTFGYFDTSRATPAVLRGTRQPGRPVEPRYSARHARPGGVINGEVNATRIFPLSGGARRRNVAAKQRAREDGATQSI